MIDFKQHSPEDTKLKLLVYGEPMVGKTSFALQFPRPLIISTDGNTNFIEGNYATLKVNFENNQVDNYYLNGWEYFDYIVNNVLFQQSDKYDTLIIDLVEHVFQMCRAHYNGKKNLEHEQDEQGFKMQYGRIFDAFYKTLIKLENLNKNLILISHIDTKEKVELDRNTRRSSTVEITYPSIYFAKKQAYNTIVRLITMQIELLRIQHEGKDTLVAKIKENRVGLPINSTIVATVEGLKTYIKTEGKTFKV